MVAEEFLDLPPADDGAKVSPKFAEAAALALRLPALAPPFSKGMPPRPQRRPPSGAPAGFGGFAEGDADDLEGATSLGARLQLATGAKRPATAIIEFASRVTGRAPPRQSEASCLVLNRDSSLRSLLSSAAGGTSCSSLLGGRWRAEGWRPKLPDAISDMASLALSPVTPAAPSAPPRPSARKPRPPAAAASLLSRSAKLRLGSEDSTALSVCMDGGLSPQSANTPCGAWGICGAAACARVALESRSSKRPVACERVTERLRLARARVQLAPSVRAYAATRVEAPPQEEEARAEDEPAAAQAPVSRQTSLRPGSTCVLSRNGSIAVEGSSELDVSLAAFEASCEAAPDEDNNSESLSLIKWTETELREVFDKFVRNDDHEIATDVLAKALHVLGAYAKEDEVKSVIQAMTPYASLSWPEFVEFIRKYREYFIGNLRQQFYAADKDKSGELEMNEVCALLAENGYTPTAAVVKEALSLVDKDYSGAVCIREFELLLEHLRLTKGFLTEEAEELQMIFDRVSRPGEGRMSTEEVSRVTMYLGYSVAPSDLQLCIQHVDLGNQGTISLEDLMQIIRDVRDIEGRHVRRIFQTYASWHGGNRRQNRGGMLIHQGTKEIKRPKTPPGEKLGGEEMKDCLPGTLPGGPHQLTTKSMMQVPSIASAVEAACQLPEYANHSVEAAQMKLTSSDGSQPDARPSLIPAARPSLRPMADTKRLRQHHMLAVSELSSVLAELGYYASEDVVAEILATDLSSRQDVNRISAEEMGDFLRAYRRVEGFTKAETLDLDDAFRREQRASVAGDNDETLDVLELGRVLRRFGIARSLQEVRRLIDVIDFDGSREVEFKEFLKLMRTFFHKEGKLRRSVFTTYANPETKRIPYDQLPTAVREIIPTEVDDSILEKLLEGADSHPDGLTIAGFEAFFSQYRKRLTEMVRKNAGFVPSEVRKLRDIFEFYDKGKKDYLGDVELRNFIQDHMPEAMLSVDGKEAVKTMLENLQQDEEAQSMLSRSRSNVDERRRQPLPGPSPSARRSAAACVLTFPQFLQFMRGLGDRRDEMDIVRESQAVKDCEYSAEEVEGLRQLFLSCLEPTSAGTMDLEMLINLLGRITDVNMSEVEELRSLMVRLSPEGYPAARFPQFLLIVKQLTWKNMLGLNDTAQQIAKRDQVRRSLRMNGMKAI